MFFQDRQGEVARVAIAVVEGHRREARTAFDEPPPRLGERNEFEAETANQRQRGVEEVGFEFEQAVGRVTWRRRRERTNAMKREDDAAASVNGATARCRPLRRKAAKPASMSLCLSAMRAAAPDLVAPPCLAEGPCRALTGRASA